jgi:glycosyltransferase involved in cell wall biosynthesis
MPPPTPPPNPVEGEHAPIDSASLQAAFRRLRPGGSTEASPEARPETETETETGYAADHADAGPAAAAPTPPSGRPPRAEHPGRWRSALRPRPRRRAGAPADARRGEPGIHQFVPNLHAGDAVGRHTQRLRDAIVARGIPSRIYVQGTEAMTASETEEFSAYAATGHPGDVLVYQFATASDLAPWLTARQETLVVNYHNVTPPELYEPWDREIARIQQRARRELHVMAPRTALAIADSTFNVADLTAAGYGATAVVPPIAAITLGRPPAAGATSGSADPAARTRSTAQGRGARWLCVGRLAPNKAVEDALMALVVTRARHDRDATLTVVGKPVQEAYHGALRRFVADMGLEQAVTFRGHISDDEVASAFDQADLLIVPSVHEGFCVPMVEAMAVGLPVVASRSGVSRDVLGEAGIMVDTHDPEALADAIAGLLADPVRYTALARAGQGQLRALDLVGSGDRIVDLVLALRGDGAPPR